MRNEHQNDKIPASLFIAIPNLQKAVGLDMETPTELQFGDCVLNAVTPAGYDTPRVFMKSVRVYCGVLTVAPLANSAAMLAADAATINPTLEALGVDGPKTKRTLETCKLLNAVFFILTLRVTSVVEGLTVAALVQYVESYVQVVSVDELASIATIVQPVPAGPMSQNTGAVVPATTT